MLNMYILYVWHCCVYLYLLAYHSLHSYLFLCRAKPVWIAKIIGQKELVWLMESRKPLSMDQKGSWCSLTTRISGLQSR